MTTQHIALDVEPVLFHIVEGWTGTIGPFTISLNSVPLDLTGMTVTPVLRRASGTAVVTGGTVAITPDQVANKGKFTYAPAAADFIAEPNVYTIHQPYTLHWKIVDGAGKIVFSPSAGPVIVMVHRA